jgi:hypothetical protein
MTTCPHCAEPKHHGYCRQELSLMLADTRADNLLLRAENAHLRADNHELAHRLTELHPTGRHLPLDRAANGNGAVRA